MPTKARKVHFYPFFSSFLTRGFVYISLWSPPALPSAAASPMLALCIPWHCDAGTQYWGWAAVTPQRRLPHRWSHKYSFQIGFSPPFTIYWIVLVREAESGVCWGTTRPLCARKTIESVREEPNAHQINSSRREETGPWLRTRWHICLWQKLFPSPPRRASTFIILFSLAAHANDCVLPEIGVTKGGWDQQRKEVKLNFLVATFHLFQIFFFLSDWCQRKPCCFFEPLLC